MRTCMLACLVVAALAAGEARAAVPAPGATYTGTSAQGSSFNVRIELARNSVRRIAGISFDWRARRCSGSRFGTQGRIRARGPRVRTGGRFTARGTARSRIPANANFRGGTQVERWTFAGRFRTRDRATGTLHVEVSVLNRAGQQVATCSTSRRIGWSARRLGVADDYELPS